MLLTVQRPPWRLAIASTIASPSPTPPADRVRAASARANRSKIRPSASFLTPQPSSSHLDQDLARSVSPCPQLDRVARPAELDRVLEQRVERGAQPLGVDEQTTRREWPEAPRARGDLRPSHEQVLEEPLEVDLGELEEIGLIGGGQQQQPADDRVDP